MPPFFLELRAITSVKVNVVGSDSHALRRCFLSRRHTAPVQESGEQPPRPPHPFPTLLVTKFIGVSSTRLVHGPHVGAAASSLRPESRAALTSPRHVWLEPAPPMLSHGPPGRGPSPQSQRGQCLLCFLPKPRLPVGAEFLPSSLLGPFG